MKQQTSEGAEMTWCVVNRRHWRKAKRQKIKEGGGGDGGGGAEDDGTGWEYKPWNRETDLEAGRTSSALKPHDMLKNAGVDLKGRFGGAKSEGGARTFL